MAYTTDFRPIVPVLGLPSITDVATTPQVALGTVITARDFGSNANGVGEFIYLKGVASTVAGSWVTFSPDDYSTALLAANAVGQVAVAMAATVADRYGWFQVSGKAVAKALAGYADNGLVYATATAGSVDDAAVAGDRVKQALGASALDAPATGMAEFDLAHPYMDDGAAA